MSRKKIAMVSIAAAAAAAGLLVTAPAANAAKFVGQNAFIRTACPGSQIDSGKLRDSHNRAHPTAIWRLYYSAADSGTNCLTVYDNKTGSHYMLAVVQATGTQVHSASDDGKYAYYAGAVGVTHMSGKCLDWAARIDDSGTTYSAHAYGVHCG